MLRATDGNQPAQSADERAAMPSTPDERALRQSAASSADEAPERGDRDRLDAARRRTPSTPSPVGRHETRRPRPPARRPPRRPPASPRSGVPSAGRASPMPNRRVSAVTSSPGSATRCLRDCLLQLPADRAPAGRPPSPGRPPRRSSDRRAAAGRRSRAGAAPRPRRPRRTRFTSTRSGADAPSRSSRTQPRYRAGTRRSNRWYASTCRSGGRVRARVAQPDRTSPAAVRASTRVAPGAARSASSATSSSARRSRQRRG